MLVTPLGADSGVTIGIAKKLKDPGIEPRTSRSQAVGIPPNYKAIQFQRYKIIVAGSWIMNY